MYYFNLYLLHSFKHGLARLIELGTNESTNTDSVCIYSQTSAAPGGLSLSLFNDVDEGHRIHTRPDCMRIGVFQHVLASIDQLVARTHTRTHVPRSCLYDYLYVAQLEIKSNQLCVC